MPLSQQRRHTEPGTSKVTHTPRPWRILLCGELGIPTVSGGGLPCTCSIPRRASFKCAVCNASFPHARCIHAVASARYARLLINANKSVQNDGDSPVCKAARNGSAGAARYANQSCARGSSTTCARVLFPDPRHRRNRRSPRCLYPAAGHKRQDQARQDQACPGALEFRRCARPWPEISRRSAGDHITRAFASSLGLPRGSRRKHLWDLDPARSARGEVARLEGGQHCARLDPRALLQPVPPVAHGLIGARGEARRNRTPTRPQLLHGPHDDLVFLRGP